MSCDFTEFDFKLIINKHTNVNVACFAYEFCTSITPPQYLNSDALTILST